MIKLLLDAYAKRLDARARRERGLIFFAGVVVIVAFLYGLGVAPALERRKTMNLRMADQANQIVVAQAQKTELETQLRQDPDASVRDRIASRRKEIAQIDSQLSGLQRSLVPPERMASVLQDLVGQDRRVRIVKLHNVAATPLVDREPDPAANGKPASATTGRHVFKHAVMVTVEGNYLDLLAYVARLEKQPWQVYWGRTTMVADYPEVQIELTLYTLSLDKAWLVV
jgi:MSHA biogenesis protein MshJ